MTDSMLDMIDSVRRCAARMHAQGATSASLYTQARMQEATGYGFTAPYTSLLAQAVAELERAEQ